MDHLYNPFLFRWAFVALFMVGFYPQAQAQSGFYWQLAPNSPFTTSVKFDDIYFIDSLAGMACNGNGRVYRTTDAGANWNLVFSVPTAYFRSLVMTDAQNAWVGNFGYYPGAPNTDSTAVYRTSDGGTTWSPAPIPNPIGICGLFRIGTQNLYGVGRIEGPASFIRSIDGGNSWSYIDMAPHCGFLVDLHFTGVDTGFVIGGTDTNLAACLPIILHTVDGGATWDTVHIGSQNPESWCWKIQFPSPQVGYVSLESNLTPVQCLKTTDAGFTWTVKTITNTAFKLQGIGFVNDTVGWAGGYYGNNLYETTDGGDTWAYIPDVHNFNRIRVLSPTLLWASGKRLYKITTTPPTYIAPRRSHDPLNMHIRRCNSGECVAVDLPDPDPQRKYVLHLFDVVGKELRTVSLTNPASTTVSLEGMAHTILYFVVTDGERWESQLVAR
jgi:photosystem II stability/assembly factor-like uncharacterized protein